jgi:hypothetical protein
MRLFIVFQQVEQYLVFAVTDEVVIGPGECPLGPLADLVRRSANVRLTPDANIGLVTIMTVMEWPMSVR